MIIEEYRKAPFLRLIFPLVGGILLGRVIGEPVCFEWILAGCSVGLLLLSAKCPRLGLAPVLFCILLEGIILGTEEPVPEVPEGLIHARICDELLASGNGKRTTIDRIRYLDGDTWEPLRGKASVYLAVRQDSMVVPAETGPDPDDLRPGRFILAQGKLSTFDTPLNPHQFDYAAFQRGKGILYQLYLDPDLWSPSSHQTSRGFRIRSIIIRRSLIEKIESRISGSGPRSVLNALLLGYRSEMDTDLRQNFARSGTLHILAVSGLHVGIIYLLPALLLRRLKHRPLAGIPASIIIFGGLWGYAFLTGLSSSVVRAVTMCCIHGLALMSRRKVNSLHVVSLTAFIMIIIRPAAIFEAGFQLSFLAVAGIILLYPPLRILFQSDRTQGTGKVPDRPYRVIQIVLRWILRMVAVSMAAQISTLPLCILYFNQFAPASVLSNLLVIPLATVILFVGFGYFVFGGLDSFAVMDSVASLLSIVLRTLSSVLEWLTSSIAEIPGAYIAELSLIPSQVILLYVCGVFFLVSLRRCTFRSMFHLLVAVVLLLAASCIREYRIRRHQNIYVFAMQPESAIVFVDGRKSFLYGDVDLPENLDGLPYELEPFFRRYKLEIPVKLGPDENSGRDITGYTTDDFPLLYQPIYSPGMEGVFFKYKSIRMLVLRKWDRQFVSKLPDLELDIIVLSDNPRVSAMELLSHFSVSQIVTDGSCFPWYAQKMEEEFLETGVAFHSTRRDGYYSY